MSPVLVRIVEKAKEGQLMAESNIFVIFRDAVKFMGRRRICEHTFAGIRASGHLYVIGCFAAKDSRAPTNYRGIGEPTRAKNDFLVRSVGRGL